MYKNTTPHTYDSEKKDDSEYNAYKKWKLIKIFAKIKCLAELDFNGVWLTFFSHFLESICFFFLCNHSTEVGNKHS